MNAQRQPWDIAEHGLIVKANSHEGIEAVKELISQRDGTYPLIIDIHGNLVIDHRFPNTDVGVNEPYVGNHRGLYERLSKYLLEKPQVVFAGQIRVLGGQVVILVDQSGTFYTSLKDIGVKFGVGERNGNLRIIQSNQRRIDVAAKLLKFLEITNDNTEVLNFMQKYGGYKPESRNEGHVKAKDAANFERQCRGNAACWKKIVAIDSRLKMLMQTLGSQKAIEQELTKILDITHPETYEYVSMWNLFLREGPIDVLAREDFRDPQSTEYHAINRFVELLEIYHPLD